MISRPKACNQFLFLVIKSKQDCSWSAKNLALTLWWQLTNKISCTQYHHKLIFCSSCHVPRRVLGGGTKVELVTIRIGGEQLLAITVDLIETTVTQRASRCHYRWYLFLFRWIIQSSIHLRCCRFVNTQRAISCRHRWYLRFPHVIIHSLIQLSCPRFVKSHPVLHLTQRMSCKLLKTRSDFSWSIIGRRRWHGIWRIKRSPTGFWRSLQLMRCVRWRTGWLFDEPRTAELD